MTARRGLRRGRQVRLAVPLLQEEKTGRKERRERHKKKESAVGSKLVPSLGTSGLGAKSQGQARSMSGNGHSGIDHGAKKDPATNYYCLSCRQPFDSPDGVDDSWPK